MVLIGVIEIVCTPTIFNLSVWFLSGTLYTYMTVILSEQKLQRSYENEDTENISSIETQKCAYGQEFFSYSS